MRKPYAKAVQKIPPELLVLSSDNIRAALENDTKLSETVSSILTMSESASRELIGSTTVAAYRRVHEVITSTLDRLCELARTKGKEIPRLLVDLSRCLILVKYQLARDQLSERLSEALYTIVNFVMEKVKSKASDIIDVANRARTLLDALAVLVYEYAR